MIDPTSTLGDLVTDDPRRARVLEGFELDYCCHGQRSLAEAASEKGLDLGTVARALDLPDRPEPADWQALSQSGLIDHVLTTHHAYLWAELGPLGTLVDKVYSVHGDRHPELASVRNDYVALANDLASHLLKEERILFPAIKDAEDGVPAMGVGGPIQQMMFEHDAAGDLLARLRATTQGYTPPADGCASYQQMMLRLAELEADLHTHIHKENNVLFPRALEASAA